MREMVLNHASLVADSSFTANEWLVGMARGIQSICDNGLTERHIRSSKHFYEIDCTPDQNFWDLTVGMLSTRSKEEAVLLMDLSARVSLLGDERSDRAYDDRMLKLLEPSDPLLSDPEALPLLYCAENDGIAVGFPSTWVWDRDQIEITFREIESNSAEVGVLIDNLTRPEHAASIVDRQRVDRDEISRPADVWTSRSDAFPDISFGPDVRQHLERVNPSDRSAIVRCLHQLNEATRRWKQDGGATPSWPINVRNESATVQNNRRFSDRRRFRSITGRSELFMWHANYGYGRRIHLRIDASSRVVEIGYIGRHLPITTG